MPLVHCSVLDATRTDRVYAFETAFHKSYALQSGLTLGLLILFHAALCALYSKILPISPQNLGNFSFGLLLNNGRRIETDQSTYLAIDKTE